MVTVRDVALAAKVSPMTVSRVINRNPAVNEEMRARVLRAVQELGYVPNSSASKLRTKRAGLLTIGVILRDTANPFSAELQRSIEDELRFINSLALTSSNDDELERTEFLIQTMRGYRVDGLIIAPPPGPQSYLDPEIEMGFPIVLVDRPAIGNTLSYVISANFEGMKSGVEHLARIGHHRIAYLSDMRSEPMVERYEGFKAGLAELGIALNETLVHLDQDDEDDTQDTVTRLLKSDAPPTAFISARNNLSIGMLKALHVLQKQFAVAHLGFDDLQLSDVLEPGFTTVSQQPTEIGAVATRMLVDLIATPQSSSGAAIVPTNLIQRGSGEIRPSF